MKRVVPTRESRLIPAPKWAGVLLRCRMRTTCMTICRDCGQHGYLAGATIRDGINMFSCDFTTASHSFVTRVMRSGGALGKQLVMGELPWTETDKVTSIEHSPTSPNTSA